MGVVGGCSPGYRIKEISVYPKGVLGECGVNCDFLICYQECGICWSNKA